MVLSLLLDLLDLQELLLSWSLEHPRFSSTRTPFGGYGNPVVLFIHPLAPPTRVR